MAKVNAPDEKRSSHNKREATDENASRQREIRVIMPNQKETEDYASYDTREQHNETPVTLIWSRREL